MKEVKELTCFFSAIRDDHRIGTTHISLYMALFQLFNLNGFQNPIEITRASVMKLAKINGFATYHKCMSDLTELGYLNYFPSYNPSNKSRIWILKI